MIDNPNILTIDPPSSASDEPAVMPLGKIYLSCSSEGYGHSSRMLAIAKHLPNADVLIGTYGYALNRVAEEGLDVIAVKQEVEFMGSKGTFDVGKTVFKNQAVALGLNQIVQQEMDIIRRHGISLVVADGRMAPVLAASRLHVPCLVITNQSAFYPFFERESRLVKLIGRSFEFVMKLWLSSAEEILIPDFPPPNTVCLPNLSSNYQVKKRTRFVGPLVAWDADDIEPIERADTGRPLIVATLGGHEYRRPLFDCVLETAHHLPDYDVYVISGFTHNSLPNNVTLLNNVSCCAPYFKAADVVITQAGHSTAMELLTLGTPSVIVPDDNQIEQENNAKRMVTMGVAEQITYQSLSSNGAQALVKLLNTVLNNPSYKTNAQGFSEQAKVLQGARRTADLLREFSSRLVAY